MYVLVSPMASFPQASPPTNCAHLYAPPYAPHALPISFVSILPPAQYWVRSTDHLRIHYKCLKGTRVARYSVAAAARPVSRPNFHHSLQQSKEMGFLQLRPIPRLRICGASLHSPHIFVNLFLIKEREKLHLFHTT